MSSIWFGLVSRWHSNCFNAHCVTLWARATSTTSAVYIVRPRCSIALLLSFEPHTYSVFLWKISRRSLVVCSFECNLSSGASNDLKTHLHENRIDWLHSSFLYTWYHCNGSCFANPAHFTSVACVRKRVAIFIAVSDSDKRVVVRLRDPARLLEVHSFGYRTTSRFFATRCRYMLLK